MKIEKEIQKINQSAGKIQKALRDETQKHLIQGKTKLTWLENQLKDEKNHKKLQAQVENVKEKVNELKETFSRFEQKAVQYAEKNPKKALALATTAGLLAGSLWNTFQNKKNSSKTKTAVKSKKRTLSSKR
jgi:ElaB/YqjD/DUF883 family membrane-anchored ribosome-binding protein